jgi:hypothetical protein
MSRLAVVDSDLLALALARELARQGASVAVQPGAAPTGHAELRLLSPDPAVVQCEAAARSAWQGLEAETGLALLHRLDALDVAPETTAAATLFALADSHPGSVLYPVEAARCWPQIRFDGLIVHQRAACRVDLRAAHEALARSAQSLGVRWGGDAGADFEIRAMRVAPAPAPDGLLVASIAPLRSWPSVRHHPGLPSDADGYVLPGARATALGASLELSLLDPGADSASQLWEYAVRWLPGTIVSAARPAVVAGDELAVVPARAAELAAALLGQPVCETERAS